MYRGIFQGTKGGADLSLTLYVHRASLTLLGRYFFTEVLNWGSSG